MPSWNYKKLISDLPVYISVFFSEIFIKVPIKNRICKRVEHSKKMQNCINHCFVPGNGTFHNFWIHVHQKVEYIQWQPGYKKDNRNTQNHDIGPSPFFIVLGMLALKVKANYHCRKDIFRKVNIHFFAKFWGYF